MVGAFRVAQKMAWMKSFSTLSRFTFDHGLPCTERERLRQCQISGKGVKTRAANKDPEIGPDRNESSRDKSQTAAFQWSNFHHIFTAFFTSFFAALFAALFDALLARSFASHVPVTCRDREFPFMSQQGVMSNEVDNIKYHWPETYRLSHPLCLRALMEHTCHTHCTPAHQL